MAVCVHRTQCEENSGWDSDFRAELPVKGGDSGGISQLELGWGRGRDPRLPEQEGALGQPLGSIRQQAAIRPSSWEQ